MSQNLRTVSCTLLFLHWILTYLVTHTSARPANQPVRFDEHEATLETATALEKPSSAAEAFTSGDAHTGLYTIYKEFLNVIKYLFTIPDSDVHNVESLRRKFKTENVGGLNRSRRSWDKSINRVQIYGWTCSDIFDKQIYFVAGLNHWPIFEFKKSQEFCGSYGGYLAEFGTMEEFEHVTAYVDSKPWARHNLFYIGAVYNKEKGRYIYNISGQTLTINAWARYKGSKLADWPEQPKECVLISSGIPTILMDVSCYGGGFFVCEVPLKTIQKYLYVYYNDTFYYPPTDYLEPWRG